eukprot:m.140633 g.140633  ORF g.140633 m.140633 type:complete len:1712 (+) comp15967_c0_seq1:231-5366(+)
MVRSLQYLFVLALAVHTANSGPCDITCSSSEYQYEPCVAEVSPILLDYDQDKSQPDITVVGDGWSKVSQMGTSFSGFFGSGFYVLINSASVGTATFSFTVPVPGLYNISASYGYYGSSPIVAPDAQRYDAYADGHYVTTFFLNQRLPPPEGNLTFLGQIMVQTAGSIVLNANTTFTGMTTRTVALDAVYIEASDLAVQTGQPPDCRLLRVCQEYEYESTPATVTSDRSCDLITNCTASQYQTAAPTATTDRSCASLTMCNATEYETNLPTATTDRTCATTTTCMTAEFELTAPTPTSDRACQACDVCDNALQIQEANCTSTSNAVCRDITENYMYSAWSSWSISCGVQTRTRTETCADIKCLNQQPTMDTRSINGGCEDICSVSAGAITCSCTPPTYLINDTHCSNVYCNIPSFEHATLSTTDPLRLNEQATVTCSSGYYSPMFGPTIVLTCRESGLDNATESCMDFDECAAGNGGCPAGCTNLDGTFCCSQDEPYQYTEWSSWSSTCGPAIRTRTRSCNATCGGVCTNDLPLMDTRDICCPTNATYTYGPYPDWMPTCATQTRTKPEMCTASCGGVCTNHMDTTQTLSNGGCEQQCSVDAGEITCSCGLGYRLAADNSSCQAYNPCNDHNGECSHYCVPGAYENFTCTCDAGYTASDGFNCIDINECNSNNGGCEQLCNNTNGSFFCSCMTGFSVDGMDSTRCNPINCQMPPATLPASMPAVTARLNVAGPFQFGDNLPYTCEPGFTVDGGPSSASAFNLTCLASGNIDGTYVNGCVDVNECMSNNGGCSHLCNNVAGNYNCTCPSGYMLAPDGKQCQDINECSSSPCSQVCTNTAGSYMCSCQTGFTLGIDGMTCNRVSCGMPPTTQYNATVANTAPNPAVFQDTVVYNCLDGYTTNGLNTGGAFFFAVCQADGVLRTLAPTACLDVDECAYNVCDQTCTNTLGSFTCSCLSGYVAVSATECQDVNECELGTPCASDSHAVCQNTPGSFSCGCQTGYSRIGGVCREQVYNLLSTDLTTSVGVTPQRFAGGWTYFDGTGALEVTAPLSVASQFSIVTQLQVAPGAGGYVFAVTNRNGTARYFAVYIYEFTQRLAIFYRTSTSDSVAATISLQSPLDDGRLHNLAINIQGHSVSIQIDSVMNTYSAQLEAAIGFCTPGPDCKIYVGQRASANTGGGFAFKGIIRQLYLYALETQSSLDSVLPYPDPTQPGPSAINLLDNTNQQVVGSLHSDSRGSLVFDGSTALIVPRFHAAPNGPLNTFTITVTAQQERGTNGYLIAKTDSQGGRYWSLYSSGASSNTVFYYTAVGSSTQSSVKFSADLSTGLFHRVMLSVQNQTARLYVDNVLAGESALLGPIADCSSQSNDCILQVGRRTDSLVAEGRYFFHGRIADAILYSGVYMTVDPTAVAPLPLLDQLLPLGSNNYSYFDLLNETASFAVGSVVRSENAVMFDGSSRLVISEHSFPLGPSLSVVGTIQTARDATGYIFAKTSQDGATRHLAMYLSDRARLTLYYTSSASSSSRNLLFFPDVILNDGIVHTFLLRFAYGASSDTTNVTLYVDGFVQPLQSFSGHLEDCGGRSASCGLAVGQRLDDNSAGGSFGVNATMQLLQIFPQTALDLAQAPSVMLAGPPFFSVQPNRYIPGQNQGGAYRTGITVEECARKCLDDALCLSFDAGTPGGSQEGACFLSYIKAGPSGTTALATSSLFVYYEKLL